MRNASIASGSLTDRLHAVAIALAGCRDRLARQRPRPGVAGPGDGISIGPRPDCSRRVYGRSLHAGNTADVFYRAYLT